MQQVAYFIKKLKATKEGDGTLLDHCMIMAGGGIGDGNRHNHNNLPVLLAGGGNGTLTPGRHVQYDRDTPLCNLLRLDARPPRREGRPLSATAPGRCPN